MAGSGPSAGSLLAGPILIGITTAGLILIGAAATGEDPDRDRIATDDASLAGLIGLAGARSLAGLIGLAGAARLVLTGLAGSSLALLARIVLVVILGAAISHLDELSDLQAAVGLLIGLTGLARLTVQASLSGMTPLISLSSLTGLARLLTSTRPPRAADLTALMVGGAGIDAGLIGDPEEIGPHPTHAALAATALGVTPGTGLGTQGGVGTILLLALAPGLIAAIVPGPALTAAPAVSPALDGDVDVITRPVGLACQPTLTALTSLSYLPSQRGST